MMSDSDYQRLIQFNKTFHHCYVDPSCNHMQLIYHNVTEVDNLNLPGDGSPFLRTTISLVYCAVCAMGLVGNALVLFLLHSSRSTSKTTINFFVFNLAVTDLLLSMVLPFWATDVALDYSWPFGWCMCKVVSFLTSLNVYASVFFLTAMSVTRCCSVATALKPVKPVCQRMCTVRLMTSLIWLGALLSATPSAVFAEVSAVGVDQACLLRFPQGTFWLAVHQLQRVVLGFLIPYIVIALSYILLLRFLCKQPLTGANHLRQAKVSRSVVVVVLSFCTCWFPNNIITSWGVLIKLDLVELSKSYYLTHTYIFPLATCLAHINSCLNPVIYCLMRKEYRKGLSHLLWKSSFSTFSKACLSAVRYSHVKVQEDNFAAPCNTVESQTATSYSKKLAQACMTLSIAHGQKSSSPLDNS
ncbi:relaxin-3 receptor 1-like [Paramormyrops kingsleyae]|uniref:Relaxin-3 receptor 1-like n=1 Tax=Paramormyrops kingsleyae TaxID=1676925 RepID=A0A3B3Q7G0_9TELE|nr:relaxin-3 receptor 1-like [Paramormyrops kingsleyae]XP_023686247.1 relaxin-3 receptor 1-like [Paramormyrops kingsleyae]